MSNKDPKFTDEMVSAYLDGELSDSEREHVERIVEGDPQYRRMLEELQSLRDSLKALPRFQLDDAFHQRVLERAVEQSEPSPAARTEMDGHAVWRRLAWVGGTIAAALLLMFFLPGMFDWLEPGPIERVGQAPSSPRDSVGKELAVRQADKNPSSEHSESPNIRSTAPERQQVKAGTVRGATARELDENVETRAGVLQQRRRETERFGVDADGGANDGVVADRPLADRPVDSLVVPEDVATSFSRINSDLDAIVYWARMEDGASEDLAKRGLYRLSGVVDDSSFGRRFVNDKSLKAQPRLMYVKGTPEQIARSLSRVEEGDTPEADDLALTESMGFKDKNLDRGRPTVADRYSRANEQDRLRRSSDLYIDLDAADSDPLVVDHVTKESEEYKKLLGFLAAKAPSTPAESNADDEALGLSAETRRPEPSTNPVSSALSEQDPEMAVESKVEIAPNATSGNSVPAQAQDQRGVRFYSLLSGLGEQPSHYFYQRASAWGIADQRLMVEELKDITPKNEDGTLRVLLVLPSTEMSVQPAAEADHSAVEEAP